MLSSAEMQIRVAWLAHYWVSMKERLEALDFWHNFKFFFGILGSVDKGVVEVTNCFCVPHKETHDQVEAEITYASDIYDLNKRVNSSESIVGK